MRSQELAGCLEVAAGASVNQGLAILLRRRSALAGDHRIKLGASERR